MEVRYKFDINIGIDLPSGDELSVNKLETAIKSNLKQLIHQNRKIPVVYLKVKYILPRGILGKRR